MEYVSGVCSLTIYGTPDLDFEDINKHLKIVPTKQVIKGQITSKRLNTIANRDVWIYDIEFEGERINASLNDLTHLLIPVSDHIRKLSVSADVLIRLFIQSDLAQIGFTLSPDVFQQLAILGIGTEFSVLSWGGVESEEGVKPINKLVDIIED